MVDLRTISATNLTLMARTRWFYVFRFKASGLYLGLTYKMLRTLTTS